MFTQYEDERNMFLALFGLTLIIRLADSKKDDDYMLGFWFTPEHLYVKNGEWTYFWDYPFITLNYVDQEFFTTSYEWEKHHSFRLMDNGLTLYPDNIYQFNAPFTFVPKYGQLQECETRTVFSRSNYTRKWMPFLTKTYYHFNIDFSKEMGNNVDSWKGGTISMSAPLPTSIQYYENNFQTIIANSL